MLRRSDEIVVYVDAGAGDDNALGTDITMPLRTVHAAVAMTRTEKRKSGQPATIVLRAGTHFLSETIELSADDSLLTSVFFYTVLLDIWAKICVPGEKV